MISNNNNGIIINNSSVNNINVVESVNSSLQMLITRD